MEWTYIISYLSIEILIIFLVGGHLFKHGAPYLQALFPLEGLDKFINKLLLTGYYLINIGFAIYSLVHGYVFQSWSTVIEILTHDIGFLCLMLGTIHFGNLFILFQISNQITMNKNRLFLPHNRHSYPSSMKEVCYHRLSSPTCHESPTTQWKGI